MTIDETQTPKSEIDAHQPEEISAAVSDDQPPTQEASEPVATETPDPTNVAESAPEAAQPPETSVVETPVAEEAPATIVAESAPEAAQPAETVVAEEVVAETVAPAEPEVKAAPAKKSAPEVEATPATIADGVSTANDGDLFEQYMNALDGGETDANSDSSYKRLNKGDRIEATVIQVEHDRVFVDLGTKAEGV
ncbi:MAG: hypothetical protein WCG75_07855, partial [Armatimonadota bacterium]